MSITTDIATGVKETVIFGPVKAVRAAVTELKDALPTLPSIPENFSLDSISCEFAFDLYNQSLSAVKSALELPTKVLGMGKNLLNKLSNEIIGRVTEALGAIDKIKEGITNAVNEFVSAPLNYAKNAAGEFIDEAGNVIDSATAMTNMASVAADFSKLGGDLKKLASCPAVAGLDVAKQLTQAASLLQGGAGLGDQLANTLKNGMMGQVSGLVNSLKQIPLQGLNKADNLFKNMLQQAGVPDLISTLDGIGSCLKSACAVAASGTKAIKDTGAVISGLTNGGLSFDKFTKLGESVVDSATGGIKQAAKGILGL